MIHAIRAASVIALFCLTACSGGGSGGSSSGQGQVALLLRDGPADQYEHIYITVHEIGIRPVGGDAPVVLFSSAVGETIDLLALEDEDLVLSIVDDVPVGSYDRVVVEVSNAETVGGPCDTLDVKIPSGRIRLQPAEPFDVVPGGMLSLRLDVDVNKSLHLHPAGASGQCIFRPVIFIDAQSGAPDDRCHRNLEGVVTQLTDDAGLIVGLTLDLGVDRGLIEVEIDPATSFFGDDGLPSGDSILAVDATVTVHGRLGDDGRFDADAILLGAALDVVGEVTATSLPTFEIDPVPGQVVVGPTSVTTFAETAQFFGCDPSDGMIVVDGADVTVTGKLSLSDGTVRAAVVVVEPPTLEGTVTAVVEVSDGYEFTVQPADPTLAVAVIFVPDSVEFELDAGGTIDAGLFTDLVACEGRTVTLSLNPEILDEAIEVSVASVDFEGVVDSIDLPNAEWTIDGQLIVIDPESMVIDLRGTQASTKLDAIEVGARLRLFGIEGCSTEAVSFYAFVVTVLPMDDDEVSEGCGHGYWKQPHHFDSWPAPYTPDLQFDEVFEDAFPGMTLLGVLQQGGGGLNSLGRKLVAALLNAASDEVNYSYTAGQVIGLFADVYPGGDYNGLKSDLQAENDGGCPLD